MPMPKWQEERLLLNNANDYPTVKANPTLENHQILGSIAKDCHSLTASDILPLKSIHLRTTIFQVRKN